MKRALDLGVDVVGGIPHFERTMADGAAIVKLLYELAAERGLLVDMHCDESDDPHSRHIESLAFETQRLGLHGRVTGSHLPTQRFTSMRGNQKKEARSLIHRLPRRPHPQSVDTPGVR